jgi:predicted transcriptional regulator
MMATPPQRERDGDRTREEILNLLRTCPGLTKTEVRQRLGLGWGTIHYHLRVLAQQRLVVERRQWGWTRIYSAEVAGEIRLMPLLRMNLAQDIMETVRRNPDIGVQAISSRLGVSRKVVRRVLQNLVDAQMLERSSHYRPRFRVKTTELTTTLPERHEARLDTP